jgi:STAS domain
MATTSELEQLADVRRPLLLDMRDVSFIDAAAIASLVRLYTGGEDDGCPSLIEACSPIVERVCASSGSTKFHRRCLRHGPDPTAARSRDGTRRRQQATESSRRAGECGQRWQLLPHSPLPDRRSH